MVFTLRLLAVPSHDVVSYRCISVKVYVAVISWSLWCGVYTLATQCHGVVFSAITVSVSRALLL